MGGGGDHVVMMHFHNISLSLSPPSSISSRSRYDLANQILQF